MYVTIQHCSMYLYLLLYFKNFTTHFTHKHIWMCSLFSNLSWNNVSLFIVKKMGTINRVFVTPINRYLLLSNQSVEDI